MPHSIHDKSLDAKKARIDCARPGVRSSFSIKQMIGGAVAENSWLESWYGA